MFFVFLMEIAKINNFEKNFIICFGKKVKHYRLINNLSQEMLANDANIPINQIGRIERAEVNTSLLTVFKIATALQLEVKELLNFDEL